MKKSFFLKEKSVRRGHPLRAGRPQTLVFKTVQLSADSCHVLAGVGEECVAAMFSGGGDVSPALLPNPVVSTASAAWSLALAG